MFVLAHQEVLADYSQNLTYFPFDDHSLRDGSFGGTVPAFEKGL